MQHISNQIKVIPFILLHLFSPQTSQAIDKAKLQEAGIKFKKDYRVFCGRYMNIFNYKKEDIEKEVEVAAQQKLFPHVIYVAYVGSPCLDFLLGGLREFRLGYDT